MQYYSSPVIAKTFILHLFYPSSQMTLLDNVLLYFFISLTFTNHIYFFIYIYYIT